MSVRATGTGFGIAGRWIACLAVVAALAACAGGEERLAGVATLDRVKQTGKVRIGYANEAPYAYRDIASGRLTGEAPEIARVILADMGVTEVEGVLTEFGALIPGLKAKRFDIIAAGMYVLPKRCQEITFSNPTYSVGEAFIVRRGNPKHLHRYEDVTKHPDATLGVVAGAVEMEYAQRAGIAKERVLLFPDAAGALEAVHTGRLDAYAGTRLTVNYLLRRAKSERIERAQPFTDPVIDGKTARGYGAFGFRKDDADLVDAFNARLGRFLGTEQHLKLVQPFGFTADELPGKTTADELCRG